MKKSDKIGNILNIVLAVLYVPLSLFSWLMQMAGESGIDATNQLYITMINVVSIIFFIIPLLSVVSIILAFVLRKKGYSILSNIIQFIPLLILCLNMLLLVSTEFIPSKI